MTENSLKVRAIRGAVWTLGGFGISRVMRLLNHLVLAWFLAPDVFGIMALVKVFIQGLEMFSDIGIKPSIIRSSRGNDPVFLNTAWSMQALRGILLWVVSCLFSVPFAWIYSRNDPQCWQLVYLIPVAAISAVLAGFESTGLATLNRELRLGKVTLLQVGTQLVTLVTISLFAWVYPSVWSMIAGGLIGNAFHLIASHKVVPGVSVRFHWDADCAAELIRFGKWIFLSTVFTFLAANIDKLSLASILSLSDFGIYGIAVVFSKVALDVAMRLGISVMYPVYSHYQSDSVRLMQVAIRARQAVLLVGGAACVCFAIASPLFFETMWDERYHKAGSIAQWLSLFVWCRILLHSMDRIPMALGNSRILFFSNVVQFLGIIPAAFGYYLMGLAGFIIGLSLGPILAHVLLVCVLPSGRITMLVQSVGISLIVVSCGFLGALLSNWLQESATLSVRASVEIGSCALVVVTFGLISFSIMRHGRAVRDGRAPVAADKDLKGSNA